MRFEHPDLPGRCVRLAYCTNLHPADDLEGLVAGLRAVSVPLAERLGAGRPFGVGPWLSARLARELVVSLERDGQGAFDTLVALLRAHRLDPFTFNAFPFGDFHREGLKQGVFRPDWADPARLAYTQDVVRVALALAARLPRESDGGAGARAPGHISISTHSGGFGGASPSDARAIEAGLVRFLRWLAAWSAERRAAGQATPSVVLGLEAEPRSHANDTRELEALLLRLRGELAGEAACLGSLGTCLDACHAAVEFEVEGEALRRATVGGTPLAKMQFTSALRLERPDEDEQGRARFFALHEPVYLHQVTARTGPDLARASDLDEARRLWRASAPGWRGAQEWRCHFHVPVDLPAVGSLGTTRASAGRLLALALAAPERWGTAELHVEIETYTWNVLPKEAQERAPARPMSALVDGLEREYAHVLGLLSAAGWQRS